MISKRRCGLFLALGAWVVLALDTAALAGIESIEGLEAWYKIETLHRKLREGQAVGTWKDSSGNDHHLVDDRNGRSAVFRVLELNNKPVVEIGKGNTHSLSEPFELHDHTIFLVYSASCQECALFRSLAEGEDGFGVLLQDEKGRDLYKRGTDRAPYNSGGAASTGYRIGVLGRESGRLRAFVNGADVSSDAENPGPIRVDRFFNLSLTRAVRRDGAGLRIAEMIFFNRYLDGQERAEVTRYLSGKYGIPLAAPRDHPARTESVPTPPDEARAQVLLSTSIDQSVNGSEVRALIWDVQLKLEGPFQHDPDDEAFRIYCLRDDTQVRVYVSLSLRTSAPGADIRVLVLRDNRDYQPDEGTSGPMIGTADPVNVRLETELRLDEGDFVEVVTIGQGASGDVRLVPGEALLGLEIR